MQWDKVYSEDIEPPYIPAEIDFRAANLETFPNFKSCGISAIPGQSRENDRKKMRFLGDYTSTQLDELFEQA